MHSTSKLPCSPGKCHTAVLCPRSLKSVVLVDLCLVLLVFIVGIAVAQCCAFVSSWFALSGLLFPFLLQFRQVQALQEPPRLFFYGFAVAKPSKTVPALTGVVYCTSRSNGTAFPHRNCCFSELSGKLPFPCPRWSRSKGCISSRQENTSLQQAVITVLLAGLRPGWMQTGNQIPRRNRPLFLCKHRTKKS